MGNTAILAIRIISDASKAGAGFDQTTAKASKMSKVGAAAGKVLAVGLAGAAAAGVKMAKAAADDAKGAAQLANALKSGAGATDAQVASTEKWITAQGRALGVSDDELRPAIARLARATGDVGKAQKLASLGMDIATGSGKSLSTVTEALAKAQTGNLGGLSRLGVATKKANGDTKSLAAIQADLAKKYAGAAKAAAQTDAGKAQIAALKFSELGEKIGALLLPAMDRLVTVGDKVADWIDRNTTLTGILVGSVGALLAITWAVSKATAAWSAATKIWSAVTKIAAGVQWLFNAAMAANPVTLVVIAIVALVAILIVAWKKSETFRKIVIGAWNAIKKATSAVWNAVKSAIKAAWAFILKVATTYVRGVLAGVKAVWNAIKKATSAVWNAIKAYYKAVWNGIKVVATTYVNAVKRVVGAVWDFLKGATKRAWDAIKSIVSGTIGKVVDFVKGLKSKVTGIFDNAKDWLINAGKNIIQGLIDGIQSVVGKVRDELGKVTGLIPDWKGPPSRDKALLHNAGRLIMQGLVAGIKAEHGAVRKALVDVSSLIEGGVTPTLRVAPSIAGSSTSTRAAAAAGGDTFQITVNGALDPDRTAAQIDELLTKYRRRRGVRT